MPAGCDACVLLLTSAIARRPERPQHWNLPGAHRSCQIYTSERHPHRRGDAVLAVEAGRRAPTTTTSGSQRAFAEPEGLCRETLAMPPTGATTHWSVGSDAASYVTVRPRQVCCCALCLVR